MFVDFAELKYLSNMVEGVDDEMDADFAHLT